MDEWLADFFSAEYVEGMESLCHELASYSAEGLIAGCLESQSPDDTNLMCEALSCFGLAFIEEAVRTLGNLEDRKQARLILCIAKAGRQSIPYLVQLLEHPSANVRAAACVGIAGGFDSEPDWPPETAQRVVEILHRVPQSEADGATPSSNSMPRSVRIKLRGAPTWTSLPPLP